MNRHTTNQSIAEKDNTRRQLVMALGASIAALAACANAGSDQSKTPFVVEYQLAPGATEKSGLLAVTDTGARIFASSTQTERNPGLSSFGGTVRLPRWVQVTWREGVTPGEYWTTGTVVGSYRVEVLSRITAEAFSLVQAGPGRSIKLQFRIKDNGVLLAWTVQEHRTGGYLDLLHDGDFRKATLDNGKVIDPGWEK
jgi:hypothetical protein